MTSPNHELFVKVLAQIEREPQRWAQAAYAKEVDCGTAYCFAGWACALSGYAADFSSRARCHTFAGQPLQTNVLTTGGMIEDEAVWLLDVDALAGDRLFASYNTLDDLYRISADILSLDETVLRDKVAAEVSA